MTSNSSQHVIVAVSEGKNGGHIVSAREKVVRLVTLTFQGSTRFGCHSLFETHRVSLEPTIAPAAIDLESLTSHPSSSEYVFIAHIDGHVSIVYHKEGKIAATLAPEHNLHHFTNLRSWERRTTHLTVGGGKLWTIGTDNSSVMSCYRIECPKTWTKASHLDFPRSFTLSVMTFLLCTRTTRTSFLSSKGKHAKTSAAQKLSEEDFVELVRAISNYEPEILSRIVAGLATVKFGCAM